MLETPYRRGSFVVLIFGLAVFAYGSITWYVAPNSVLVQRTSYVPEYPLEDYWRTRSLVQFHRSCDWTALRPASTTYDPHGPVMVVDTLHAVDSECAGRIVDKARVLDLAPRFWAKSLQPEYGNVLFKREIAERYWFSSEELASAHELYRKWFIGEARRTGLPESAALMIGRECIRSEQRWCIESARLTHVHVWREVSSNPAILIGLGLTLFGLMGSVFWGPLVFVWNATARRLCYWVKSGK